MTIEVRLPSPGEGIESSDVLELLVHAGQEVRRDQDLLRMESEKATFEVPSPENGRILKIHVEVGESVPVDGLLLTMEPSGAATTPARQTTAEATESPAPTPSVPVEPPAQAPGAPADSAGRAEQAEGRVAASPGIRRLARSAGVDLRSVAGTGVGGRITREDVQALADRQAGTAGAEPPTRDAYGPVRYEPLTKIRQTIATRLHESWSMIPRVTNFDDADVTDLERLRESSKAEFAAAGLKLTSLPFIIKAAALALVEHARLNASLDLERGRLIYKHYVNIGVAVDTERGLVVPSLRSVDTLPIPQIVRELDRVASMVRSGSFPIEETRGSTFTISNLGAVGGTYSTPIINHPEVAILLVGRARPTPVVLDGEIAVRLMLPLSLSYDHRVVDGADAARYLNAVIGYLQSPGRLLLTP